VVEADARKREQIRRAFARRGYRVEAAVDEGEAVAKVRAHPFEVALLSAHLVMDPADGWSVATSGIDKRLRLLRPEMTCLVLNQREYQPTTMPTRQILTLTERVLRQREVAQRDQRLARRLEESLRLEPCLSLPEFDIACIYEPYTTTMRESARDGLGGDFYDVFTLPDGRVGILLGDVSGRGLQVATFTAMARYYARAYAHQRPSAAYILEQTNAALEHDIGDEMFVTLFCGILDPRTRQLTWANAGHEAALYLDPVASTPVPLLPTGAALAMLPDALYEEETHTLSPGSLLLLYTDGLIESWARQGQWEKTPLRHLLLENRNRSAGEIAGTLFGAVRETGDHGGDDLTLIVIRSV
jgi:serine phosphatase RsbU (regulator of sigma subunit)